MTDTGSAEEQARQWQLLYTPLGEPGSGRVRYAAAMYLRMHGALSDEALEVYRILSRLDSEDPAPLLDRLGGGSMLQPPASE